MNNKKNLPEKKKQKLVKVSDRYKRFYMNGDEVTITSNDATVRLPKKPNNSEEQ